MRPLPTRPTKTFQSPNVATSAGFADSSVLSAFFGAASAEATAPTSARAAAIVIGKARRIKPSAGNAINIRPRSPPPRGPRKDLGAAPHAERSGRNSGLRLFRAGPAL